MILGEIKSKDNENFGVFRIPENIIVEDFETVKKIMNECTSVLSQFDMYKKEVRVYAVSEQFRCVNQGESIPEYNVVLNKDGSIKFEEIKNV